MAWNLILQSIFPSSPRSSLCLMGTVPGLAQPAQIHLVSCDSSTDMLAGRVFDWIDSHLGKPFPQACGGPATGPGWFGGIRCRAFQEPACLHVLVFFKGSGIPLGPEAQDLLRGWDAQAGARSEVVVIVPAGEDSHDLPNTFHHYHRLYHPAPESELGLAILRAAGVGAKRKLFLSYRRQDTRALADQIHEELARQGFQVYVDRFSWMPGRLFPEEIAEELADNGVMLLLESDGLHRSRWTQWELSFARIYHLGILALNVDGAPWQRGIQPDDRHNVSPKALGKLRRSDQDTAIRFILRRYSLAELRRRVYFESLVRRATAWAGGSVAVRGDGIFEVRDGGRHHALVLPSGRPANLEDLCRLGQASLPSIGRYRILGGQHQHLPRRVQQDMGWLAPEIGITLRSTFGLFPAVRNLIWRGRP